MFIEMRGWSLGERMGFKKHVWFFFCLISLFYFVLFILGLYVFSYLWVTKTFNLAFAVIICVVYSGLGNMNHAGRMTENLTLSPELVRLMRLREIYTGRVSGLVRADYQLKVSPESLRDYRCGRMKCPECPECSLPNVRDITHLHTAGARCIFPKSRRVVANYS